MIPIQQQDRQFLSFSTESQDYSRARELRLPGQKIKKLRQEAAMVIRHHRAPPTAQEVSHLLCKFNSVSQAIPPGPLFCRAIQRDLAMALVSSK